MASNEIAETHMGETLGKLLAGAILYDFDGGKRSQELQKGISKARKWLGEDDSKKLLEATQDQQKALIYACIDKAVLNRLTPETSDLLSKLDATSRVFIEMIYLRVTGQDFRDKDPKQEQRWSPGLWNLKKLSQKYLELSPSKVKEEDFATAIKGIVIPMVASLREHIAKLL